MKLTIRAFAGLAERLGGSELTVNVERETLTVSELKDVLANLYPGAASLIAVSYFAKNQAYARPEELVTEKDELALIPPVSGGQGCACGSESIFDSGAESSPLFTLTSDPISVESVTAKINHPSHGATIAFVGNTREFTYDSSEWIGTQLGQWDPTAALKESNGGGVIG